MKKFVAAVLCAVSCAAALPAGATPPDIVLDYDLPGFKYYVQRSNFHFYDDFHFFAVAAVLNDYVCQLQQTGKLKDKPVVIRELNCGLKIYETTMQLYETKGAYRLNYYESLDWRDIVRVIDYLACDDFEPLYYNVGDEELFFRAIDLAGAPTFFEQRAEYEVYRAGRWSVRMFCGPDAFEGKKIINQYGKDNGADYDTYHIYPIVPESFGVFWDDEPIDVPLDDVVFRPVVMNDCLIVLSDTNRFSVFEADRCIKSLTVESTSWFPWSDDGRAIETNIITGLEVYPQWLNIRLPFYGVSYSYAENRLYTFE